MAADEKSRIRATIYGLEREREAAEAELDPAGHPSRVEPIKNRIQNCTDEIAHWRRKLAELG